MSLMILMMLLYATAVVVSGDVKSTAGRDGASSAGYIYVSIPPYFLVPVPCG
jgi:hypothetical protein